MISTPAQFALLLSSRLLIKKPCAFVLPTIVDLLLELGSRIKCSQYKEWFHNHHMKFLKRFLPLIVTFSVRYASPSNLLGAFVD